jgi:hypothetical protein
MMNPTLILTAPLLDGGSGSMTLPSLSVMSATAVRTAFQTLQTDLRNDAPSGANGGGFGGGFRALSGVNPGGPMMVANPKM